MNDMNGHAAGRLLLVEDDEAIQTLIKTIFDRQGLMVDCAADGDDALARLRRVRYDAVILDLMLPGANGFEIIQEMKSRERGLLDRTIVLTAAADVTLRDFTDGQLVRRLIRKPFDLDELVAEVLSLTSAVLDPRIALPSEQHIPLP
jgi:two-component system OmpR family response regulator